MIASIILAAGASSRMGSPKALLDYRGESFVERLIRIFSQVCDPVIVVLGYHADAILPRIVGMQPGKLQCVINRAPERGQLSSLQTGVAALSPEMDGFLFLPVDCPAVELETVEQVIREFRRRDPETLLVIPQYRGKHGHPVCAAPLVAQEFLALPPTAQAREVIHGHLSETIYVDVDDPGILTDIDDPDAYRRFTLISGEGAR